MLPVVSRLPKHVLSISVRAIGRTTCSKQRDQQDEPTVSSSAKPWEDPWAYALRHTEASKQDVSYEAAATEADWEFVERLLPHKTIPIPPQHESYPTPSGWFPPKYPPTTLPYYVRRTRDHVFPTYLERRRDDMDVMTFEFNYVELVVLRNVQGDVVACKDDVVEYLQRRLGHSVAAHANELNGTVRIKGADRSLVEQFLAEKGF